MRANIGSWWTLHPIMRQPSKLIFLYMAFNIVTIELNDPFNSTEKKNIYSRISIQKSWQEPIQHDFVSELTFETINFKIWTKWTEMNCFCLLQILFVITKKIQKMQPNQWNNRVLMFRLSSNIHEFNHTNHTKQHNLH